MLFENTCVVFVLFCFFGFFGFLSYNNYKVYVYIFCLRDCLILVIVDVCVCVHVCLIHFYHLNLKDVIFM